MFAIAQNNASDRHFESLASTIATQQEISFATLKEAQNYFKKIKQRMAQLIANGDQKLVRGLRVLSDKNPDAVDYVAKVSGALLKQISSPKNLRKTIQSDVLANQNSLTLFMEAIDQYIDCGDTERELSVLTVLMVLFPANPQPYIYFGSSIWRNDGIDAAASYYAAAVKILPNPALYLFAAGCFYQQGNSDKAKELLQLAEEFIQKNPGSHGNLENHIVESIQQC